MQQRQGRTFRDSVDLCSRDKEGHLEILEFFNTVLKWPSTERALGTSPDPRGLRTQCIVPIDYELIALYTLGTGFTRTNHNKNVSGKNVAEKTMEIKKAQFSVAPRQNVAVKISSFGFTELFFANIILGLPLNFQLIRSQESKSWRKKSEEETQEKKA